MKKLWPLAIAVATLGLYASVIVFGRRLAQEWASFGGTGTQPKPWRLESLHGLNTARVESIELGRRLFDETPVYGATYVHSRIACSNCHLQGGAAPFASPMVGIAPAFPLYSKRAGRAITLEDRIQECVTRSENGQPLPADSPEMQGLLAYIRWLAEPHPGQKAFTGRGLEALPSLQPNPAHGAEVYAGQCAGCHGVHGEGTRRAFPPLWGPEAFNDGAGMHGIDKMAAFVHYNMPQNRKGILSAQDAYDVAAYIHQQPRPAFNHAYDRF